MHFMLVLGCKGGRGHMNTIKTSSTYLWLILACEGGGGHVNAAANGIKIQHKSTSGSLLHVREVEKA